MFPLNLLGLAFTGLVLLGINMLRVRAPMIDVDTLNAKRFQQRFELQKNLVLSTPKHVR